MKLVKSKDGGLIFYCEGCKNYHGVSDAWHFNGDFEKPTLLPSVLVRGVEPVTDEEHDLIMSGTYIEPRPFVCHSFVTDGKIRYLGDCTHEFAGQTLELEDIE